MNDMQMSTQATMDTEGWPQSWEWEEFLFAGRLHRCGYAMGRVMVLVVALGGDETTGRLTH